MRMVAGILGLVLAGCASSVAPQTGVPVSGQAKVVQDALVVRSIAAMGEDGAVVQLTYKGTVPLARLVLALTTDKVRLTMDAGAVTAGQTFDVVFEKAGSGIGGGGHVAVTVESVR